jgi:hypothetical protein
VKLLAGVGAAGGGGAGAAGVDSGKKDGVADSAKKFSVG